MSEHLAWDDNCRRFVGSAVPGLCEAPGCTVEVFRSDDHACGLSHQRGCGRYFCDFHLQPALPGLGESETRCEACSSGRRPFEIKPDVVSWLRHLLGDASWAPWRAQNRDLVTRMKEDLNARI